ncbi:capsular exopolysaccharide synthesis family protein [Arcicella aurantiaca]|uniref:non-specific protein-tyrosine kinase n=1 Tax=Arcicella aurantiaca TaxID=591202 RepID=A0A316DVM9_9BACT|nr:polysaccharide biosynthesis tyrosine autokinase [Arcicella aurantiaca]PWK22397.1 capsular exopolysaccharide synthesis family protein [Arcicella aurantiaca]
MNNIDFFQESEDGFDLKIVLLKYLRYWYWFVIALAIAFAGAFLYLQYSTTIYKVTSVLLIKDDKKGGMGGASEMLKELDISGSNKIVENEMEVLKSRTLFEKVVDDLNLTVSYYSEGNFKDNELFNKSPIIINYSLLNEQAYNHELYIITLDSKKMELLDEEKNSLGKFNYSSSINCPYGKIRVFLKNNHKAIGQTIKIKFAKKETYVEALSKNLHVDLLNPKSTVVQLSMESEVPDKGKAILGKLLEAYSYNALEDKNLESTNTLRFIEDRLHLISKELKDVEGEVETYKTQKGITDLSEEANLFLEKVKENDTQLNEVDVKLKVLEGVEQYLQNSQRGVAPSNLMVSDPVLIGLLEKLNTLELEQEKTSRTTQPQNPFLQTIKAQVKILKQDILDNVANQKKGLGVTKLSFQNLNNRFESSIRAIPKKEREFVSIKRQQGIKESLYLLLLQKREETALSYASTVTDSRVIDSPYSSPGPIKPNKRLVLIIALLSGLSIPIFLINIIDILNDKVQSRKDIEKATNLSIFGEIGLKPKGIQDAVIDLKSRSFLAEQFRILRTNLQYVGASTNQGKSKVFIFTSSTSGEGKSFVSINLAASIATLGKKVALLELDLRKPKISAYLGMSRDRGISNYLVGQLNENDIIQSTKIENLYLLASGPIPPNPAELLSNGRIEELINKLKETYDYVLIDSPPVGLVTDSLILGAYVDACFYLVRHEVTPKQNLAILTDIKFFDKFKSVNVIFNGVNYKNSQEYRYGYGYGYY